MAQTPQHMNPTVRATAYLHKCNQAPCFIYSFIFAEGGGVFFSSSIGCGPLSWRVGLLPYSITVSLPYSTAFSATFRPNGILSSAQALPALLETLTLSLGWHCRSNMLIHHCCCLRYHHLKCWCNWYSCEVFQLGCEWNPDERFLWNRQRGHAFFMDLRLCWCHRLPLWHLWQERAAFDVLVRRLWQAPACLLGRAGAVPRACEPYDGGEGKGSETGSARHSNWHSSHLCSRTKEVKCRWDSDQL